MPSRHRLAFAAGAFALLAWAAPASAEFGTVRRVTSGTAFTLEKGEFTVGVIGPMQYGILDELQLTTHPVLHLLLTPNLCLKGKAVDSEFAVLAFSATYIQTFLNKDVFPGTLSFFPSLTVPIGWRVALTVQGGYVLDVYPIAHGVTFGGGVNVLATESDLLTAAVQAEWYHDDRGIGRPTVMVTYTHAFYQMRLSVGVAIGRFPIQVGDAAADFQEWPAYPMADVWWQL
jgi:hypothetical protein